MSIFISILIALLPVLIQLISGWLKKKTLLEPEHVAMLKSFAGLLKPELDKAVAARDTLSLGEKRKVDRAVKQYNEFKTRASQVGCEVP